MKPCENCSGTGLVRGKEERGYFWKECRYCDGYGILFAIVGPKIRDAFYPIYGWRRMRPGWMT